MGLQVKEFKEKCGNCGSDQNKIKRSKVIKGGSYVQCCNCDNSSVSCETRKESIVDWNDRNEH